MTTHDNPELKSAEEGTPTNTFRTPIAAAVAALILTLGLFLALGTGNHHPHAKNATPAPPVTTPQATPTIPAPPFVTTPFPTTPAAPIIVAERWHGTVTVSGPDSHKDLDNIPPRTSARDGDLNGDWLETTITADSPTVQIAVLPGGGTLPGYGKCRDIAYANGSDHTEQLKAGDVLCVITSDGRIARLKTVRAEQTSTDPVVRFNVTVWDTGIASNRNQITITPR